MSPANFMNHCRLCLVKDKVSIPIFEGEGEVRNIFMKIVTCLPIKVERHDRLPKKICDVCLYNVENVFKFWHTTANSEKKLLQWLEETGKVDNLPMDSSSTIEIEQVMLKEETVEQEPVSEHSKSQDNEGSQDDMERSDLEDTYSDEDGFNSEEDPTNDNVGDKKDSGPEEGESEDEDGDEELEPTTFVNVAMACEEPGPSGLQPGQTLGQDVEGVDPEITQDVLQPVHTVDVPAVKSVQSEPEVVPSTSKTDPASSGSSYPKHLKLAYLSPEGKHRGKTCEFCGKVFEKLCNALDHRRKHTGEKPYLCHICGLPYISLKSLRSHLDVTHAEGRQFACDICGLAFKHKNHLGLHRRRHTEGKKFACDLCGHSCHSRAEMNAHNKRHLKMYAVMCKVCQKGFYCESELRDHMVRHSGTKPFKCDFCSNAYVSKNSLTCHINSHHNKNPVDLECDICHKKFSYSQSLRKHKYAHMRAGSSVCDVCGKLITTTYMKIHMRTHTGEKPIVCNVCNKSFRSAGYLKTHMRVHTGEKPYACTKCEKCFTQRSTLVIHMRSHTGEKPYSCSICSKSYVTHTLLLYHQKTHSWKND